MYYVLGRDVEDSVREHIVQRNQQEGFLAEGLSKLRVVGQERVRQVKTKKGAV